MADDRAWVDQFGPKLQPQLVGQKIHRDDADETSLLLDDNNFYDSITEEDQDMGERPTDLGWRAMCSGVGVRALVGYYVPIIHWLPMYNIREYLIRDLLAGISIAMMLIPQGLAYASLCGVPPQYGLYAGTFPIMMYTLMGQSRQLAVGPDAVAALLSGQILNQVMGPGPHDPMDMAGAASLLALLIGLWLVLFSFVQIGFIENLISRPILDGFVSAAGLIIVIEQTSYIFGIHLEEHEWHKFLELVERIDETNLPSLYLGLSTIIFYFIFDIIKKKIGHLPRMELVLLTPTTLIVVVISIVLSVTLNLPQYHIATLGHVDVSDYPIPWLPHPSSFGTVFRNMLVPSATLAIIIFTQAISLGKRFSVKYGYSITSDREMTALGLTNIIGAFFRCIPSGASMPRSQVADAARCATQLGGFVASVVMTICLLTFIQLFSPLPKVSIGAIITVAAIRLIEFEFSKFIKIRAWSDILMFVVAALATFWLGPIRAIIICLGISAYQCIRRVTMPKVIVLGQSVDGGWHDMMEYSETKALDGIVVLRIDSDLFFGNIDQLRSIIGRVERLGDPKRLPTEVSKLVIPTQAMILDLSRVTDIDKTSLMAFHSMVNDYYAKQKYIVFVTPDMEFRSGMAALGLPHSSVFAASINEGVSIVQHFIEHPPVSTDDHEHHH